jgi:hypothetical protein
MASPVEAYVIACLALGVEIDGTDACILDVMSGKRRRRAPPALTARARRRWLSQRRSWLSRSIRLAKLKLVADAKEKAAVAKLKAETLRYQAHQQLAVRSLSAEHSMTFDFRQASLFAK